MLKTILQTFLGILLSLGAIVCFYFFLTGLSSGVNFLFPILALGFLGGAIFFFIRSGKSDTTVNGGFQATAEDKTTTAGENFSKKLAQNNAMLSDWKKTNDTKERLRMLEISAKAGEE